MSVWFRRVVWMFLAVAIIALAVRFARPVYEFMSNEQAVQLWLDRLGPWGPLGVIVLNTLQVVIAIIPGYAMQIAAGFLYGFPLGAVYGGLGMTLGGLIAMSLARAYGRPLVVRMIGATRMERWQDVTRFNSLSIWVFMMIGPFGDVPYYIAGLTKAPIWKIMIVAVTVRIPSVIVAAAVGAGLVDWHSPWILGSTAIVMLTGAVVVFNQQRLDRWIDEAILPRLVNWMQKRKP